MFLLVKLVEFCLLTRRKKSAYIFVMVERGPLFFVTKSLGGRSCLISRLVQVTYLNVNLL